MLNKIVAIAALVASICQAKNLSDIRKCIRLISQYERVYSIPTDVLQSIALVETGTSYQKSRHRVPWPWSINRNGVGYHFATRREAKNFLHRCIRAGEQNIDVGCMQISLKHHRKAFPSLNAALEPKHNIKYAAMLLHKHYKRLKSWQAAITHYHSSNQNLGTAYYFRVKAAKREVADAKRLIMERANLPRLAQVTKKHQHAKIGFITRLINAAQRRKTLPIAKCPGILNRILLVPSTKKTTARRQTSNAN